MGFFCLWWDWVRLVCDGGMGRDLFLVLASGGPFLAPACLFACGVAWSSV